MNKSITQDNQNDNQISLFIRRFFTRFRLSSALKAANAYKKKIVQNTATSLVSVILYTLAAIIIPCFNRVHFLEKAAIHHSA